MLRKPNRLLGGIWSHVSQHAASAPVKTERRATGSRKIPNRRAVFRSLSFCLVAIGLLTFAAAAQAQMVATPSAITVSGKPGDTVSTGFSVSGGFPGYTITPMLGTVTQNPVGNGVLVSYNYQIPMTEQPCSTLIDEITIMDTGGDATPNFAMVTITIKVIPPSLAVVPTSLSLSGAAGEQVSATINLSGGNPNYTITADRGTLTPSTLTAAGSVTYAYQIPAGTAPGEITDTITISDSLCTGEEFPRTATVAVTITVIAVPIAVTPASYNLTGNPGETVTGTPALTVSGGSPPYSLSTSGGGTLDSNYMPNDPGNATYSFAIPSSATPGQVFNDLIRVADSQGAVERVQVRVVVARPPEPPPKPSTDKLVFVANPGDMVKGSFRVVGGAMPTQVSAGEGSVNPETLTAPGDVEYSYTVPGNTVSGTILKDTITLTDSLGRSSQVDVEISVSPLSGIPGLTKPEQAVAGALDKICPELANLDRPLTAGEQDLLNRCTEMQLDSRSDAQGVKTALGQLSNQQASAAGTLITQTKDIQLNNLEKRLSDLRSGAKGISVQGLAFNLDGQAVPASLFADAMAQNRGTGAAGADSPELLDRLGVFISGSIDFGDKDGTSNEFGFDFDTGGITAGVDYWFTKQLNLGAAIGYTDTGIDYDSNGGSLDTDGWSFSLYGNYNITNNFYVDGIFNYGALNYDSTRRISYDLSTEIDRSDPVNRKAKADYDGDQYSFSFGTGYNIYHNAWTFNLFGIFNYTRANINDYTEKGADGLDLRVDDQTIKSLTTTLGSQVSYSISTSFGVLIPELSFDWEHEFEDDARTISNVFVNDPGGNVFDIPTDRPDRNYFHLSPGISAIFPNGVSVFLDYEVTLGREDITENVFTGGIRFEF